MDLADLDPPRSPMSTRDADERRPHWLSRPFVRAALFLAAGALLHVGAALLSDAPPGPTIVITDADVTALEIAFAKQTGRAPTPELRRHLVDREIDDRLLVAEARARGWHRTDPVVQRRLVMNQRFLEADAEASDAALLERAYEQGMDRTDVVVKRRLLERMRLAVAESARREAPTTETLEAYRVAHPELFRRPARIDLVQVFLSRDRRGAALDATADELAERLRTEHLSDDDATRLGDPSLLPTSVRGTSQDELARRFGHGFAAAAFAAEPGAFEGPIESSFGVHFVRVVARTDAWDPPLAEIEGDVRSRVEREREKDALVQLTKALRERAQVRAPDLDASAEGDAG